MAKAEKRVKRGKEGILNLLLQKKTVNFYIFLLLFMDFYKD